MNTSSSLSVFTRNNTLSSRKLDIFYLLKQITGTLQIIKESLQLVKLLGENSILFQHWLVLIVEVAEDDSHHLVLMIIKVITEIYLTIKTVRLLGNNNNTIGN